MNTSSFNSRMSRALQVHAPAAGQAPVHLQAALAEAIGQTGRMARASLVLSAAEAAGMPETAAERLACAIEYWHLASLLLDDLPCMDDAEARRGRSCLHRVHGEPVAILTALSFINRAYTLVGEVFTPRSATVRRKALALVEMVMGPNGIVGGQAADLAYAHRPQKASTISHIAWQKTGTFLWLCVALPALWGKPDVVSQRSLRRLGVYWGLAYQGIDDLGDVLATSLQSGKTTQRDAELTRPNLALVLGVPAARNRVERLLHQASHTIAQLVTVDPRQVFLAQWHQTIFVARHAALRAA